MRTGMYDDIYNERDSKCTTRQPWHWRAKGVKSALDPSATSVFVSDSVEIIDNHWEKQATDLVHCVAR